MDKRILEQYIDACENIKEIEKEIEIKIDIEMDRVIGRATVPRWGGALCTKMFGVRRQKKSGPCKAQET